MNRFGPSTIRRHHTSRSAAQYWQSSRHSPLQRMRSLNSLLLRSLHSSWGQVSTSSWPRSMYGRFSPANPLSPQTWSSGEASAERRPSKYSTRRSVIRTSRHIDRMSRKSRERRGDRPGRCGRCSWKWCASPFPSSRRSGPHGSDDARTEQRLLLLASRL